MISRRTLLLLGLPTVYFFALRSPVERLVGEELGVLMTVVTRSHRVLDVPEELKFKLLGDEERRVWAGLPLSIATGYPGETPDTLIHLHTSDGTHLAMYNRGESAIYFSFVPDACCSYGWLMGPPPGGWTQPLYQTPATPEALKLFNLPPRTSPSLHRP